MCAALAQKRPFFGPLSSGLNRKASKLLHEIVSSVQWKHHLQMLLSGAQITACNRHWLKQQESAICPHCLLENESQAHRMCECEKWGPIREEWASSLPDGLPEITSLQSCATRSDLEPKRHSSCAGHASSHVSCCYNRIYQEWRSA